MRKLTTLLLLIPLLVPVPATAQGQDSEVEERPSPEALTTNSDLQDEILTRLDSLVAHAGRGVETGAEFTWPILVRQQIAEGVVAVGSFIFFLMLVVAGIWVYNADVEPLDRGESIPGIVVTLVGGFGAVIGLMVVFMTESIVKLINPEYYALEDIFTMLGIM